MLAYVAKLGIAMLGAVHYRLQKLLVFVNSIALLDLACLGLRVFLNIAFLAEAWVSIFLPIIRCHHAVFL